MAIGSTASGKLTQLGNYTASTNFRTPDGVGRVYVVVNGAGGGGGGGNDYSFTTGGTGGSALKGGAWVTVIPGTTYAVTCGAGGNGGNHSANGTVTAGSGGAGGATAFDTNALRANGGNGGSGGSSGGYGQGGTAGSGNAGTLSGDTTLGAFYPTGASARTSTITQSNETVSGGSGGYRSGNGSAGPTGSVQIYGLV
jgi:hypothetical protein